MAKLRVAYQAYVGDLLKLAGISEPAARAERIVALETKIATAHLIGHEISHSFDNTGAEFNAAGKLENW